MAERLTTEEFVSKAERIHNKRYSYEKTKYTVCHEKVTITCPVHGDFEQRADKHLSGCGCPECFGGRPLTEAEFISKATKRHSGRYSYNKVVYRSSRDKVTITCHKHGDFEQSAGGHLNGFGCQKCNSSKGEHSIRRWLEDNQYQFEEQVRFASCKNINQLPFDFEVSMQKQVLIEFHGQQHYEPFSFRSKKEPIEQMEANLARIQLHDAIKAKWCEDNNIPLLVIPYWDKHRIPELLEEFLGSASLVGAT